MASWFTAKTHQDPVLGTFERSGGWWRGSIDLGDGQIVLAVPGTRSRPDPGAIDLARAIHAEFAAAADEIDAALLEHRSIAVDAGMLDPGWSDPVPAWVRVMTLDRERAIEIGYEVAWDDDHTLGAIVRDHHLIELNGSVLAP